MSDALKLLVAILLCSQYVAAQTASTESGVKAFVLQKNEGELRNAPSARRRSLAQQ